MARWKLKPRAEFSGGGATSNSGIATVSAVNAVSAAEKPYKAEMEYLESDGRQYIDTGYKPNNNTKVVAEYAFSDLNKTMTGDGWFIFGARSTFDASDRFAVILNGVHVFYLQFGTHGDTLSSDGYVDTNKHTIEMSQDGGYVDGNLLVSYPESSFDVPYSMYLFGTNNSDAFEPRSLVGKIYSFEIYESGELMHDYITVLDNNDVACMYDKVTGQFFYNQGSGDFKQGPITYVVPEPEPEPTPVSLDSVDFQIGANSGENNMLNVDLGFSLGGFKGDVTSIESASDTLNAVDELKKTLNEKRSEIGVSRNRIDGIIESQSIKIENLSASHSAIVDTDFAKESATLVKSQILQQATSSLLKQANITQQLALQLLQ